MEKHIEINSKAPIKGYRVKIHFGTDKNKAKEIKGNFLARFPAVSAYEKYDQPNFNIRVGDFRTKLEAYKFLKEIQQFLSYLTYESFLFLNTFLSEYDSFFIH